MPQDTDRVARLMSEVLPRGLLETTEAEPLVLELLEAGLRANPRLADRLEATYRDEDERADADKLQDAKRIIRQLSEILARTTPEDLDTMSEEQLDTTYRDLRAEWAEQEEVERQILAIAREREEARRQLVEAKHGPLVRIECSYSIVTPSAFTEQAKKAWLDAMTDSAHEHLRAAPAPTASIEETEETIFEEHIKPLLLTGEAR